MLFRSELNSNGRVISLNLGSFGPEGDIPAAIGELTELNTLYLGTHNDHVGNKPFPVTYNGASDNDEKSIRRMNYFNNFLKKDTRASFSEVVLKGFELQGIDLGSPQSFHKMSQSSRDVGEGDLTNGITSIPEEIGNLKKLEVLYIANGHISTLPESMSEMESLTDLEIYNCPKMTKYPYALNRIPHLEALNFCRNRGLSHQELFNGYDDFARNGAARKEIQILYLGNNNLEELPESFSNLEKLGMIEVTNNKIKKIHPLGKNVNPVIFMLDDNEIEEIPVDADGIYCGIDDLETFTFSNNKLKVLPNIFTANTVYTIDEIDFSFNQIESIEGEDNGTYKGMMVKTFSLQGNRLKKFPNIIFNVGSYVNAINLNGNHIEEFEGGSAFSGKYLNQMEALDLSFNKLTELPGNFNATTVPYLYALDLSYNRFGSFPVQPLNVSRLTVMAIRHQRDANGNRSLREWPTGLYTCPSLSVFYIGGNDLRKIDDRISYLIYVFEIKDNPNIVIDMSDVFYYIHVGAYNLMYDSWQDIRGCDALVLAN